MNMPVFEPAKFVYFSKPLCPANYVISRIIASDINQMCAKKIPAFKNECRLE